MVHPRVHLVPRALTSCLACSASRALREPHTAFELRSIASGPFRTTRRSGDELSCASRFTRRLPSPSFALDGSLLSRCRADVVSFSHFLLAPSTSRLESHALSLARVRRSSGSRLVVARGTRAQRLISIATRLPARLAVDVQRISITTRCPLGCLWVLGRACRRRSSHARVCCVLTPHTASFSQSPHAA